MTPIEAFLVITLPLLIPLWVIMWCLIQMVPSKWDRR